MVIRHAGTERLVKGYGKGAKSRRLVLPGADDVIVKVNEFSAPKGWEMKAISNNQTEVALVLQGRAIVTEIDSEIKELGPGDVYVVQAGDEYCIKVVADLVLFQVFCPEPGPLPDDD